MKYENGLFIFHRDLRIIDNNGLNMANIICKNIHPIFIFTPEQVTKLNPYKSENSVQFMIESLLELSTDIKLKGGKLYFFFGENNKIITECVDKFKIDAIIFNYDYTPYAIKRDNSIIELCKKLKVECFLEHDYYLHFPGSILNGSGGPYQKFTPYYNKALTLKFQEPATFKKLNFNTKNIKINHTISLSDAITKFTKINNNILVFGGRHNGLIVLKKAVESQKHYSSTHNNLSHPTTQLSAYIKYGCVSIREVYSTFKSNKYHDLIRQLIWRDFYANILFSFPHVLGHSLKPNYDKIKWARNTKYLNAWKNGLTGFPIVDAGMRQLNTTGYMHNRARLIVASVLVKTLLIDWREGEQYFATKLTDYDVASNNGNWEWIMGGGADSQPYFRVFNPWLQSKEYDSDASYIKKWIPELSDVPARSIHKWYSEYSLFKNVDYPSPIVDYNEQKKRVIDMYKRAFN